MIETTLSDIGSGIGSDIGSGAEDEWPRALGLLIPIAICALPALGACCIVAKAAFPDDSSADVQGVMGVVCPAACILGGVVWGLAIASIVVAQTMFTDASLALTIAGGVALGLPIIACALAGVMACCNVCCEMSDNTLLSPCALCVALFDGLAKIACSCIRCLNCFSRHAQARRDHLAKERLAAASAATAAVSAASAASDANASSEDERKAAARDGEQASPPPSYIAARTSSATSPIALAQAPPLPDARAGRPSLRAQLGLGDGRDRKQESRERIEMLLSVPADAAPGATPAVSPDGGLELKEVLVQPNRDPHGSLHDHLSTGTAREAPEAYK